MADSAATKEQLERGFHLGPFLVEPEFQRISRGEASLQLEPKVMEVLVCLAGNAGRTVAKERFMDEVWGGTIVTEDALLRCISELRKIFEDDPRSPAFIETIRKKGYRLIAPVVLRRGDGRNGVVRPNGRIVRETPWPLVWGAVSLTAIAVVVVVALLRPAGELDAARPLRTLPLTSYPGEEADPNLSPDGSKVAFVWDGGQGGDRSIYVKQMDVGTLLKLTSAPGEDFSPTWSDDGRRIAFVREEMGRYSIFVMPAVGGSERRVVDLGEREVRNISWSPDGITLALSVQSLPRGPFVVSLMSLETPDETILTQPPPDFFGDVQPVFSPDGSRIAFVRRVMEKVDDVFVIGKAGGPALRLTSDHSDVTGLDWTPDGRDLIYTSDPEGASSLWRVPASGGRPRWIPITGEGAGVYQISVARRKWRMAFVGRSMETNLWEIDLRSRAARAVISSTRLDDEPNVSPDGRQIAFVSNRLGNYEVWVSRRDGSNPVQITELRGPFVSSPSWSPDGSRLAFVARIEGQVDVYTVDAEGGTPRRLTTADSNDREPHWSRDGEWIYFTSNRTGVWEIWKRPVREGESMQVTRSGGFAAMESPDREWLYFVKRSAAGIYRMRLPDGGEEMVVGRFEPYDWGNWTVDTSGLYYIDRTGISPRLVRRIVESDEVEELVEFPHFPKSPGLAVVPGGSGIVYTRVDRRDSDILLVEEFR